MSREEILHDFGEFWNRFFPEQAILSRDEALKIAGEPQEGQLSNKPDEEMTGYQDRVAGVYGAYERMEFQLATLSHILENLTFPKEHLVSLGAGPGSYELWLLSQRKAERVTLVDHSFKMLERARDIAEDLGIKDKVKLIAADTINNNLPPASADIVFCINALQWSRSWKRWIFEIMRLAKLGGEAFISCSLFMPRSKITVPELQKEFRKRFDITGEGLLVPPQQIGETAAFSNRYFLCGRKRRVKL